MNENYEIENTYLEDTTLLFSKLQKRTIIVIVLYVITFISAMFREYRDFDVIFSSFFFKTLLTVSVIMTIINLGLHFFKDKFDTEEMYKFIKREKEIYELVSVVPFFIAFAVFLNSFVISLASVDGPSMEPNYYENDTIVISHSDNYERFDVVIIKVPEGDSYTYFIKRIIGLPGETVIIENNKIYIEADGIKTELEDNTTLPNNAYTACQQGMGGDISDSCTFTIPEDSFFVLGDNRLQSNDSRGSLSYVHISELYGKVIMTIDFLNN